jgi:2-aminoadipate transaminase
VIYASSLSKILAPGLRLGWLVLPPGLRDAVVVAKQARDLHTSTVDQRAAVEYLGSGALGPHLERIRAAYGLRLAAMLDGLPAALPEGSRWTRPDGGMFVWLTLPPGRDTGALLPRAVEEGVAYVPGAPFFAAEPLPHTARVSFATLEPPQIAEALGRLGRALA